ncbi:methyl-accepting chemotaxis protein [Sphingomonas humi]
MSALLILCGGIGAGSAWLLRDVIEEQESAATLLRSHMNADMMHDAVRGDVLAILLSRDPQMGADGSLARRNLEERLSEFRASVARSRSYPHSVAVTDALDAVAAPLAAYETAALTISDLSVRNPIAADRALPAFFARFEQLEGGMAAVSDAIEADTLARSERSARLGLGAVLLILAAMAGALLVAHRVAAAMQDRLIRPLISLAGAIKRMAAGECGEEVPGAARSDELGTLARGVEAFRNDLRAAEDDRAAQSSLIVGSIGQGLAALARGALDKPVEADLQAPFATLKTDFNSALESLGAIVGEVGAGAAVLRSGITEIAEANSEISRRTERNAASLEETTAALGEIDQHVKETAGAAAETVAVASSGMAALSAGRATTDSAVSAMNRVSESARGIDAVIEGLDKIAFQTRVLAMNAAVEAGRAGEAGRGFAVVADLVSALAMRAEEEAKLAREQLTATQTDIGDAVEAVRSVDQALDQIAGNVEAVNGRIAGIASANDRQASVIGQIREAIEAMSNATQQSAAMVEESAAAAGQLMSQAEQLSAASARFTLPGSPAPRAEARPRLAA